MGDGDDARNMPDGVEAVELTEVGMKVDLLHIVRVTIQASGYSRTYHGFPKV